jgi:hypothetical protein
MYEQQYFVRFRGRVSGPFSVTQLQALHRRGQFGRFHEVSADRRTWEAASCLTEVFPPASPAMPALPEMPPAVPGGSEPVICYPEDNPAGFAAAAGPSLSTWEEQQGWRRVRTGLLLVIISMFVVAGAIFLGTFGFLIAWAGSSLGGLYASVMVLYILSLAARAVEAVGYGFLAAGPRIDGKGLAVAAFVLSLFWPLFFVVLALGRLESDSAAFSVSELHVRNTWQIITLVGSFLGFVLDGVRMVLILRFLQAAASYLQYLAAAELARAFNILTIVYAVFLGLMVLMVVFWSTVGVAVMEQEGSGTQGLVLMILVVMGLSELVLYLFWFIRFLLALFQMRGMIGQAALRQ